MFLGICLCARACVRVCVHLRLCLRSRACTVPEKQTRQLHSQIVGNLPYYITSQILFTFIDCAPAVHRAVVTMQWEVI